MVDNATLRANARAQLGGNIFRNKWMMMLAVCLILPLAEAIAAELYIFGAVAIAVISGPISYGVARTTVECVEGRKWNVSHAFYGFSEDFGGSALLGLLSGLFTALWSLLLIVPGIVKAYSYSMAFYIRQEGGGQNKDAIDCITESRMMMDGHKGQLFCLDLSFLGWYLLGALCLGIGILFVAPYHEMARANFYEALKAERLTAQAAGTAEAMPAEETSAEETSGENNNEQ